MNWLMKLGLWMEKRRVLRHPDLEEIKKEFAELSNRVEDKFKDIKDSQQIPQTLNKELTLIRARMDRLELFVGLKREPQPQIVPGAAKIQ